MQLIIRDLIYRSPLKGEIKDGVRRIQEHPAQEVVLLFRLAACRGTEQQYCGAESVEKGAFHGR